MKGNIWQENYILLITVLIYFPFLFLSISNAFFSIIYNLSDKIKQYSNKSRLKLSEDLISITIINKYITIGFGILPLIIMALIYNEIVRIPNYPIIQVWKLVFILMSLSFIFLHFYKNSFEKRTTIFLRHIFSGVLGLLFLIASTKIIISLLSLIVYPEEWLSIRTFFQLFLVPNFLANYFLIIINGFFLAGGFLIFLAYRWRESDIYLKIKNEKGNAYEDFVRQFAMILIIAFAFIQPPLFVFYLYNLPDKVITKSLYAIITILFLLMIASIYSYLMLKNRTKNYSLRIAIITFFVFELFIINGHLERIEAAKQPFEVLIAKNEERKETKLAKREIVEKKKGVEGEKIFKERCAVCHSFDKKIVGPPYKMVLSKYDKDIRKLMNFIRKPVKVDPAYPPMPQLGLSEEEIEAVAKFLLSWGSQS